MPGRCGPIDLGQQRPVERELAPVGPRHLRGAPAAAGWSCSRRSAPARRPARRSTWPLTGESAAPRSHRAGQRNLGARAFGEQGGVRWRLGHGQRLIAPAGDLLVGKPMRRLGEEASRRVPALGRWHCRQMSQELVQQLAALPAPRIARRQRTEGAWTCQRLIGQRLRGRERRRRIAFRVERACAPRAATLGRLERQLGCSDTSIMPD